MVAQRNTVPVVFADWNAELFRRGTDRLRFPGKKGEKPIEHPLVEFSLNVGARSDVQIDFFIEGHGQSVPCSFRLDRKAWFATDAAGERVRCGDAEQNREVTLLELLQEYPRSEVYDEFADAAFKLREHQLEVEQVRRGLRAAQPPDKTFNPTLTAAPPP